MLASALLLLLFPGAVEGPPTPLEPEADVEKAPSPPTGPPGSPKPAESENPRPRTSKRKAKVEE